MLEMDEFTQTVCAVVVAADVSVMLGWAMTVMVPVKDTLVQTLTVVTV